MRRFVVLTSIALMVPMAGAGQCAEPAASDSGTGAARIWYLHNSGWAIETERHLLVFDYIPAIDDTVARLITRLRNAAVREGRHVVVFVSHEHQDHYSGEIFGWQKNTPDIVYVFGWDVGRKSHRIILAPRQDTLVAGLGIRTLKSTDLGVGFLVRVDSLVIFHAGDHALWDESDQKAYVEELEWLMTPGDKVDIAFLPIATGTCEARENIKTGAGTALIRLRPAVAFPMHVRCTDRLWFYREFAVKMRSFAGRGALLYAERLGDGFAYDRRTGRAWRLP